MYKILSPTIKEERIVSPSNVDILSIRSSDNVVAVRYLQATFPSCPVDSLHVQCHVGEAYVQFAVFWYTKEIKSTFITQKNKQFNVFMQAINKVDFIFSCKHNG